MSLAEMYVQGVSTRKVKEITEQLCGVEISAAQVSRATAQLDGVLQEWRERPLEKSPIFTWMHAMKRCVRLGRCAMQPFWWPPAIDPDGHRQVLGTSVSLSEHETHWKAFLKALKERGLHGVQLVISDDHEGLGAARRAVLGSVPWQRCQFHLQQNAGSHVPRQSMRMEVAADIRAMFNTSDRKAAEEMLQAAIQKYTTSAPGCRPGWRITWSKDLRCLSSHWSIALPAHHEQSGKGQQRDPQKDQGGGCFPK